MKSRVRVAVLGGLVLILPLLLWLVLFRPRSDTRLSGSIPPTTAAGSNAASTLMNTAGHEMEPGTELQSRARERVEQIRAAQEQLRAGAQPGDVKEPVK